MVNVILVIIKEYFGWIWAIFHRFSTKILDCYLKFSRDKIKTSYGAALKKKIFISNTHSI